MGRLISLVHAVQHYASLKHILRVQRTTPHQQKLKIHARTQQRDLWLLLFSATTVDDEEEDNDVDGWMDG